MVRRKRTFSPHGPRDPSTSTDALCRAVKRLHTGSPATSFSTSTSEGAQADSEVSSSIARATANLSIYKETSVPAAAAKLSKPAKQALSSPGSGDLCEWMASAPRTMQPIGSDEQRKSPLLSVRTVAVAKQRDAMDSSAKAAVQSQAAGEPAVGSTCNDDSGGDTTPPAMTDASAVFEHMQRDVQGIQHGIAGIAVNGDVPVCVATDEEGVAQPSTPSRQEDFSPIAGKAHLLGTRDREQEDAAYAKLYEETNMLLKGLHFARLQRTTGS